MQSVREGNSGRKDEYDLMLRIPPDLEGIHAKLDNWAAWSRDRKPWGHCRSIEFRYRPEAGELYNDELTVPVRYDVLSADAMNKAVRELPTTHRLLLHYHYIHKLAWWLIRKELGLRRDKIADELNAARRMANNRARAGG